MDAAEIFKKVRKIEIDRKYVFLLKYYCTLMKNKTIVLYNRLQAGKANYVTSPASITFPDCQGQ